MPNGHGPKEYGGHKYPDHDGTSNCEYGCGCWTGPARSGGPAGLDPYPGGKCPKNPVDGKLLGGNDDHDHVVNERIKDLSSRLHRAEESSKQMSRGEAELADELRAMKAELEKKNKLLAEIRKLLEI